MIRYFAFDLMYLLGNKKYFFEFKKKNPSGKLVR